MEALYYEMKINDISCEKRVKTMLNENSPLKTNSGSLINPLPLLFSAVKRENSTVMLTKIR